MSKSRYREKYNATSKGKDAKDEEETKDGKDEEDGEEKKFNLKKNE